MTLDILIALIGFAFVSSVTPGPNNLMLMASGANYGFLRTIPHMLGISIGHAVMTAIIGLGLGQLFATYPNVRLGMQICSSVYLAYLAYKIATAAPPGESDPVGKPFTFLQAAAFQWVNPKAVSMAIYAITNFTSEDAGYTPALIVAATFGVVNLPSIMVWIFLGTQIKRMLKKPGLLRLFNWVMAITLLLTLYPVWFA